MISNFKSKRPKFNHVQYKITNMKRYIPINIVLYKCEIMYAIAINSLPFKLFCLALSTLLVGGASILLKIDPSKSILFKNIPILLKIVVKINQSYIIFFICNCFYVIYAVSLVLHVVSIFCIWKVARSARSPCKTYVDQTYFSLCGAECFYYLHTKTSS